MQQLLTKRKEEKTMKNENFIDALENLSVSLENDTIMLDSLLTDMMQYFYEKEGAKKSPDELIAALRTSIDALKLHTMECDKCINSINE